MIPNKGIWFSIWVTGDGQRLFDEWVHELTSLHYLVPCKATSGASWGKCTACKNSIQKGYAEAVSKHGLKKYLSDKSRLARPIPTKLQK